MQKQFFMILTLAFMLVVTGSILADDHTKKCPGQTAGKPCAHSASAACCKDKAGKTISLDYEGKRLYFCCDSSMEAFKKDPETHLKKMSAMGLTFDASYKPQATCPVMGGAVKKDYKIAYAGMHIYACCPGCFDKITAEPAKYVKAIEANGESPILNIGGCASAQAAGKPCSKTCSKPCGKGAAETKTQVKEKVLEPTS
jgi:YHS domain-containing protein